MHKPLRQNVAALMLDAEGRILACRRSDNSKAWQLPQGGIEEGESRREALFRELLEELGVSQLEILGYLDKSISYSWPDSAVLREDLQMYSGQEQWYFLVRQNPCYPVDLEKASDKEFVEVCWVSSEKFLTMIGGFKEAAYREAVLSFREKFPELIL